MKIEHIRTQLESAKNLSYEGTCNDCGKNVLISIRKKNKTIVIEGGAVYTLGKAEALFFKCDACFEKNSVVDGFYTEVHTAVLPAKKKIRR